MPLHLTYRPTELKDVLGNRETVEALGAILARKADVPHAMLFSGPSGCGKTTLARIVATAVGAREFDLREINSADFRGIDSVREILHQMHLRPMNGKARAWIIDEAHQLSKDAQNAFLKALEDTPPHVYFLLATTEPDKLLKTIQTRCMEFKVSPLGTKDMMGLLTMVLKAEGATVAAGVLEQIEQDTLGSARLALVVLDKIIDLPPNQQVEAAARQAAEQNATVELCRALLQKAPWKTVAGIIKGLEGQEPESIRRAVLGYCSAVLLSGKNDPRAYVIGDCFRKDLFTTGKAGLVLAAYEATNG